MTKEEFIDAAAKLKALAVLVHCYAPAPPGKHTAKFEVCPDCAGHREASQRLVDEAVAIGQRRIDREMSRLRRQGERLMSRGGR